MKKAAIIGPTASGKSDLALSIATKYNAYILSLDSLSIYREIDIASAKPSKKELAAIRHYGIDICFPDAHFHAANFGALYEEAKADAQNDGKNLIIVGGTGFYLKSLIEGLSPRPDVSPQTAQKISDLLENMPEAYALLQDSDPTYALQIDSNDSYRITKGLEILLESGMPPSQWFALHPREEKESDLPVFEIETDREYLRERITLRTRKMAQMGLVDEVCFLERRYGRLPKSMQSIGIKEVLMYLDGEVDFARMEELISTHTYQLAKRQRVFNQSQFSDVIRGDLQDLEKKLDDFFQNT